MLNVGSLSALSRMAVGILPFTLFFYAVATLTSMAAMEIFGWTSALLVLFVLWSNLLRPIEQRPPFPSIAILDGALILLFLVIAIGAFLNGKDLNEMVEILGRARWIFLFLLVRTGLAWIWSENFTIIVDFLIGIFALIVIYSIVQHFTGVDLVRSSNEMPQVTYLNGQIGYRVSAFFRSSVTWGHIAALLIGFPASLFFLNAKRHTGFHWYLALATFLTALSILMTFSYGAWIAGAASLLVVTLYSNRLAFFGVLAATFIVASGLYYVSPEVKASVDSSFIGPMLGASEASATNTSEWNEAMKAWAQSPWVGSGFGEGGTQVISNANDHAQASTYSEFLIGTGVIGLTLYLAFIIGILILSQMIWAMIPAERIVERGLVLGVIAGQVALHVGGFFDSNFKDAEVNHIFLFSLAMLWAIYNFYAQEHGLRIVRPKSERPGF